jgi:lipopolysaccharide transport system permease protein
MSGRVHHYPQVVDAQTSARLVDLPELWRYRRLALLLAARDVKLRFRQTKFGAVWLVVNPLLFTFGYAFLFHGIGHVSVKGHNYLVFTYVGMSLWAAFNSVFNRTCNCLLGNRDLLTHAYFPRLSVPIASILATQVDVLISWFILGIFLVLDGAHPSARLVLIPVWFLLVQIAAAALGLVVASWTLAFRDLQNITAVVIAMGPIITPVAYPTSSFPSQARFLATLNPLTPMFDGMRASALGAPCPSGLAVAYSVVATGTLALAAAAIFRRAERTLADVI